VAIAAQVHAPPPSLTAAGVLGPFGGQAHAPLRRSLPVSVDIPAIGVHSKLLHLGVNPNGTWSLYVVDDASGDAGSMSGWDLTVHTSHATCSSTPLPDLAIAKTHAGSFVPGQMGAQYTITVSNVGPGVTSGVVTVTDTPPSGLTATAASGTGWTCGVMSGTATCTRSDPLPASTSYPPITLTVNVAGNAPALVTNVATVSGTGDWLASDDSASDPTCVDSAAPVVTPPTATVVTQTVCQ